MPDFTVKELNQNFLDIVDDLKSQPAGAKQKIVPKLSGVAASEAAAKIHATAKLSPFKSVLKEKFERLGVKHQIAPALLAGIASRESNMGMALKSIHTIYYGWGDYSTRWKHGEKSPTYHGFGVLQMDRITCPFAEVKLELNRSLGKIKLDPYEDRWLEWGIKTFTNKLSTAGDDYPKLASAEQFATALSKYNGGHVNKFYPENDKYTTGHDYANDTLARARWYAKNWEQI